MSEIEIKINKYINDGLLGAKTHLIEYLEKKYKDEQDEECKDKILEKIAAILNSEIYIHYYSFHDNTKNIHIKGTDLFIEKMTIDHFTNFTREINKLYDFTKLNNYPKSIVVYEAIKRLYQQNKITQNDLNKIYLDTKQV